jgi:hypothetical protein
MERRNWVSNEMTELKRRSGNVQSDDKFVSFIYQLLRDYINVGDVEQCVLDSTGPGTENVVFTNGYLAEYAKDIVKRLNL